MGFQLTWLAVWWIMYGIVHSMLAGARFKARMQRLMGSGFIYYRIMYVLFAFISLAAILWYQLGLPAWWLVQPAWGLAVAGAAIGLSGLALMAVCIRKYFMGLSGLRALFHEQRVGQELIITGVHRYVRHPLYLGTFLFIWGLLLVFPQASLLVMDLVITIYTVIAIPLEEQKLVRAFGSAYTSYQQNVPKLIPRAFPNRTAAQHNAKKRPFAD